MSTEENRETLIASCLICRGEATKVNDLNLLGLGHSKTYRCHDCGVLFRNPLPDEDTVKKYYQKRGDIRYPADVEQNLALIQAQWINHSLKRIGAEIKAFTYVEFGAGRGWLVSEMAKLKTKKAIGYEVDEASMEWGKDNLKVDLRWGWISNINNIEIPKNGAIMFSVSHVLEHLHDPKKFLEAIRKACPEAYIFVEVPDGHYEEKAIILDESPHSSLGQHFWSFTEESLIELLSSSGFKILNLGKKGEKKYYNNTVSALKLHNFIRHTITDLESKPFSLRSWILKLILLLFKCGVVSIKNKLSRLFAGEKNERCDLPVIRMVAKAGHEKQK